jgi:hypothetical protein
MVPGDEHYEPFRDVGADDPASGRSWLLGGVVFAVFVTALALWPILGERESPPEPSTVEATLSPLPTPSPAPATERAR